MRFPTHLLVAALAAVLLALPAAAGAAHRTTATDSLLRAINRARAAYGLHALALDPTLARAAQAHTVDMTRHDYFAHGAFEARMLHFDVRGPFVGENLAWGTGSWGTPQRIVEAWLKSPEHRANLLRPGYRRIGIAEVTHSFLGRSGANVVTADFAGS